MVYNNASAHLARQCSAFVPDVLSQLLSKALDPGLRALTKFQITLISAVVFPSPRLE